VSLTALDIPDRSAGTWSLDNSSLTSLSLAPFDIGDRVRALYSIDNLLLTPLSLMSLDKLIRGSYVLDLGLHLPL